MAILCKLWRVTAARAAVTENSRARKGREVK